MQEGENAMILRYPAYYDSFRCIADRCEDTCCAGWEIDIDDASFARYMEVPGTFGKRLRDSIQEYGGDEAELYERHGFLLTGDKRCPFLAETGLCDLYRELGEEALCDVCTNTPRNIMEYGGERELAISASCPEAGRLIFGAVEPVSFVGRETEGNLQFGESAEEIAFAHAVRDARDQSIRILQNRRYPVERRAAVFLQYAKQVQDCLNVGDTEKIKSLRESWENAPVPAAGQASCYHLFLERMECFSRLDSVRGDWLEMLLLLQKRYVDPDDGAGKYARELSAWEKYVCGEGMEYEYEHLLVYYAFMCLPRCVDDSDFIRQAKLCLVSFLVVRDMDMAWYHTRGVYTKEDRLRIVRLYAREVEHSEENLDALAEDFLFEDVYTVDNLLAALTKK